MIVAPAGVGDIDTIMIWRQERTAWLAEAGQDQWAIPLPRSAVSAMVLARQTWMVWDGEVPAATIALATWPDLDELWKPDQNPETLWHPGDDPHDALYAAKMMVPLARAGEALGEEMLDWASGRAFEGGLSWLRVDAWTTNTQLHDYYRRAGFQHVRTVASRVSGACFQRPSRPYSDGRFKTQD